MKNKKTVYYMVALAIVLIIVIVASTTSGFGQLFQGSLPTLKTTDSITTDTGILRTATNDTEYVLMADFTKFVDPLEERIEDLEQEIYHYHGNVHEVMMPLIDHYCEMVWVEIYGPDSVQEQNCYSYLVDRVDTY